MKVNAQATVKDLARVQADILAVATQTLKQLAALAVAEARATASFKDRTGRLRNSIRSGEKSRFRFFAVAGNSGRLKYAQWIEAGSQPHEIRAKNRKFLRFEVGGVVKFTKRVWHPGTKPARFMLNARNATEAVATQYVEYNVNAVIQR